LPRHLSSFKAKLLAGVATVALLSTGTAIYSAHADRPLLAQSTVSGNVSPGATVALPDFTQLATRVKPAVVSVRVKADAAPQLTLGEGQGNPFEGTPFDKFFRDMPGQNGRGMQGMPNQHRFVRGQGSGFFISADGYLVTNNHVVDKAVEVQVVTDDGTELTAKVIGTDPKTDLALLKVDGHDFPFVELSKEKPRIGEWVVAMGNPFGLGGTVTAGIVSAQGRDIGSGAYDDFIQIDAAVNRGNSGGPTFNMKGEVIGVNTAIYSPSGGSVGIAFDIPATTVASIMPQLQKGGQVERGWLGVQVQPVTKDIAEGMGLKEAKGALVAAPQPGSPAAKAGLKSGDAIVAVGGTPIKDGRDLARKIAAIKPGTSTELSIVRDGQAKSVNVTIERLKEEKVRRASAEPTSSGHVEHLGLAVAPASEIEGAGRQGLAVVGVESDGRAAEAGLQEGDVILKAGGKTISDASDLEGVLSAAASAGKQHAVLLVRHQKNERYVAVPVAAS
jgi:serine protease Do